jgi:hypothetical protein
MATKVLVRDAALSYFAVKSQWQDFMKDNIDCEPREEGDILDQLIHMHGEALEGLLPKGCLWRKDDSMIDGPPDAKMHGVNIHALLKQAAEQVKEEYKDA